jgi:amidase
MTATPRYQQITADYKSQLASRIPQEYLLTNFPRDVSNLVRTSDLRDAIATRQYTSVAVTTAYLKAAAIVHGATNCLMDYFPEEALARANELDIELERTSVPVGPLHGVPISIKGMTELAPQAERQIILA